MKKAVCIMACCTAVLCTACKHKSKASQAQPPKVEVFKATIDTLPTELSFTGATASITTVEIEPKISGTLLAKHYKSGNPVRKGQLLYTIDPSLLQTQRNSAFATLQSARAALIEARNNYNRAVPLAKIDAISQSSLDAYTAQYSSAEAQVRSAEAEYHNASLNVTYTKIYAPISGIISNTDASEGDYVGVGTQYDVLSTIADNDTITVTLNFPSSLYYEYRDRFGIGSPSYNNSQLLNNITLTLADGTTYPYKGSYDYTAINVGDMMGTVAIVVKFPNLNQQLKAGEYAKVTVDVGTPEAVIAIPQKAVIQTQNVNSVLVLMPDNSIQSRNITLGSTYGTLWIIKDGLKEGEIVLLAGQQRLHSGEHIIPIMN